jgi:hypothetical protein
VQASPTRQESPVCSEYTTLDSLHLQATSYICCRKCPPSLEARNRSQASARKGSASRVSSCCAPPTAGAGESRRLADAMVGIATLTKGGALLGVRSLLDSGRR